MFWVATGLLAIMALVFLAANAYASRYPALGYVRAFAEAAMVGGLADWFAVTALFRHPLGLPIPHTAIVPRNKDRIAATLAIFLRTNFLTSAVVSSRLERLDMAAHASAWLTDPSRRARLRHGLGQLVQQALAAVDDRAIGGMLRHSIAARLRALEVAPLLGLLVEGAIADDRHRPLLEAVIRWASRTLAENEETIRLEVRERTGWLLRLAGVDAHVADQILSAVRALLEEVAADPEHRLRQRATAALADLAFDLKHIPDTKRRVETLKNELIDHPAVGSLMEGLWDRVRAWIVGRLQEPDAPGGRLDSLLEDVGQTLGSDPTLRDALNNRARSVLLTIVEDYGDEIVGLVSETIRGWDARTVVDKIEAAVGRDLQYIRINGTLIGGLVGLVIYSVSLLL